MGLALDRIEIESVGSDPVRLARALLSQMPDLDGWVPIEEIALALDIVEIRVMPLHSIEACLQCDRTKSRGQIVVREQSSAPRRRYSIGHELGHFLNERHLPASEHGFDCTADDMTASVRTGRGLEQEREANTFAIEVLTPRALLKPHLGRAADLKNALDIARRFDVSREAAIRRYVDLHPECLAAVFSLNGRIRYIVKSEGFPSTGPWRGHPVGGVPGRPRDGDEMTGLDEVDARSWLTYPGRHQLFAQVLYQQAGHATTLLVAEPISSASIAWEPPTFRRSGRRR